MISRAYTLNEKRIRVKRNKSNKNIHIYYFEKFVIVNIALRSAEQNIR